MNWNRGGRPINILLVEDGPGDARLTQEALRECKVTHVLYMVRDGEETVRFLRHEPPYNNKPTPDMIMLDLNLPRMDGREVLARIKNDPDFRRIPVVVLSTSKAEEDIARAYDLHCNCYITVAEVFR
jgi:two-component system, chemotaxis family, response regulator Rcp1